MIMLPQLPGFPYLQHQRLYNNLKTEADNMGGEVLDKQAKHDQFSELLSSDFNCLEDQSQFVFTKNKKDRLTISRFSYFVNKKELNFVHIVFNNSYYMFVEFNLIDQPNRTHAENYFASTKLYIKEAGFEITYDHKGVAPFECGKYAFVE